MTRQACPRCRQQDHHRPDCPEMSFANGRRRDVPGNVTGLSTMSREEEMSRIFAGSTERMIERHVKAMRARAR